MAAKRWSYAEITKHTEDMIRFQTERAAETRDDPAAYRIHRDFAHGAFLLWHRITIGRQNGDDERLRALIQNDKEAQ